MRKLCRIIVKRSLQKLATDVRVLGARMDVIYDSDLLGDGVSGRVSPWKEEMEFGRPDAQRLGMCVVWGDKR
jgi:hypothetical protein